jgi:hypothetical protein
MRPAVETRRRPSSRVLAGGAVLAVLAALVGARVVNSAPAAPPREVEVQAHGGPSRYTGTAILPAPELATRGAASGARANAAPSSDEPSRNEPSVGDLPEDLAQPGPGEDPRAFYNGKIREEESRVAVLEKALAHLEGTREEIAKEPDQPAEAMDSVDQREVLWSTEADVHRWKANQYRERLGSAR